MTLISIANGQYSFCAEKYISHISFSHSCLNFVHFTIDISTVVFNTFSTLSVTLGCIPCETQHTEAQSSSKEIICTPTELAVYMRAISHRSDLPCLLDMVYNISRWP